MSTDTQAPHRLDLSGRVALVTGGTKGIGEAIVRQLADSGARVVAVSRSTPTQMSGTPRDGEVVTLSADVAVHGEVDQMVAAVVARHGTVDILVNCAGTAKRAPALEQPDADWRYMVELNLFGTLWACRAVAPIMQKAGRGRIINISSVAAEMGLMNRAGYGATKAAVRQLTRCLALEWGRHGITVNAVGPGITVTPLVKPYLAASPERERTMLHKIPLGRLGTPEDMSGAVLFLASDLAGYITGQTIYVDGGWSAGDVDW